ncbi:MAG: Gfo/Idh/MocA family oxidoreductase [Bacteroidales bacterium]|nr:Gfo/Idh/MocA family oxidoreductase [Bacteroidales bacterium]
MNATRSHSGIERPPPINTVIVGFGLSGSVFHASFIHHHPAFRLHGIVTSAEAAAQSYPQAVIYRSLEAALSDPEVELVVICSPHTHHVQQATLALEAGKHVVAEKPVGLESHEVELLGQLATRQQKLLVPFHNRRWDGDFLTLKDLLSRDLLGTPLDFESRFDRFAPTVTRAHWRYQDKQAGGTLFDLGPHLVDQCLVLFGMPLSVHATLLNHRNFKQNNDGFDIRLFYPNLVASLKAGVFVRSPGPRFQLHGTKGSFVKYGLDSQESFLRDQKDDRPPIASGRNLMQRSILITDDTGTAKKYPVLPGRYMTFYDQLADAIKQNALPPVSVEDAIAGLKIIEAAIMSHQLKKNIDL